MRILHCKKHLIAPISKIIARGPTEKQWFFCAQSWKIRVPSRIQPYLAGWPSVQKSLETKSNPVINCQLSTCQTIQSQTWQVLNDPWSTYPCRIHSFTWQTDQVPTAKQSNENQVKSSHTLRTSWASANNPWSIRLNPEWYLTLAKRSLQHYVEFLAILGQLAKCQMIQEAKSRISSYTWPIDDSVTPSGDDEERQREYKIAKSFLEP